MIDKESSMRGTRTIPIVMFILALGLIAANHQLAIRKMNSRWGDRFDA